MHKQEAETLLSDWNKAPDLDTSQSRCRLRTIGATQPRRLALEAAEKTRAGLKAPPLGAWAPSLEVEARACLGFGRGRARVRSGAAEVRTRGTQSFPALF
jgi:hypothetical protein